jgi:hypothetical protein
MSETQPLLGAVKKLRAISSGIVYQGRAIRGRQQTRVDGTHGSYEIFVTEGEEFECDQDFAKQAVMSGKAVLVSGGNVEVIPQADGLNIYKSWLRNLTDPAPVFECCEVLRQMSFGDGCLLPPGFRCRLDIALADRTRLRYEDEQIDDLTSIRVLKPSPKKQRMSAAEQAGKINAIFEKLYPATAV